MNSGDVAEHIRKAAAHRTAADDDRRLAADTD